MVSASRRAGQPAQRAVWRSRGTSPAPLSARRARTSSRLTTTGVSWGSSQKKVTTQSTHAAVSCRTHASQSMIERVWRWVPGHVPILPTPPDSQRRRTARKGLGRDHVGARRPHAVLQLAVARRDQDGRRAPDGGHHRHDPVVRDLALVGEQRPDRSPLTGGRATPARLAVEDDDGVGAVPGVQPVQRIDEPLALAGQGHARPCGHRDVVAVDQHRGPGLADQVHDRLRGVVHERRRQADGDAPAPPRRRPRRGPAPLGARGAVGPHVELGGRLGQGARGLVGRLPRARSSAPDSRAASGPPSPDRSSAPASRSFNAAISSALTVSSRSASFVCARRRSRSTSRSARLTSTSPRRASSSAIRSSARRRAFRSASRSALARVACCSAARRASSARPDATSAASRSRRACWSRRDRSDSASASARASTSAAS